MNTFEQEVVRFARERMTDDDVLGWLRLKLRRAEPDPGITLQDAEARVVGIRLGKAKPFGRAADACGDVMKQAKLSVRRVGKAR